MIKYLIKKPSVEEYKLLRNAVDWNLETRGISWERAVDSLKKSPLCICAYNENKIIGMVRLAGDLEMYGYIQDTIVLPEYQRKGVGTRLIGLLLKKIGDKKGYLLGVCPSNMSVGFYDKLGFKERAQKNNFRYIEIT